MNVQKEWPAARSGPEIDVTESATPIYNALCPTAFDSPTCVDKCWGILRSRKSIRITDYLSDIEYTIIFHKQNSAFTVIYSSHMSQWRRESGYHVTPYHHPLIFEDIIPCELKTVKGS